MPNAFTILGPSPAPPMVCGEITLCFDSDRTAGELLKIIPLRPTELVSRSETRYNPIEHRQNPGFWTYKAEKSQSFDTEPLFRQLADMLRRHERAFRQATQEYAPCKMFVRLYAEVQQPGDFPAIRIPPELSGILAALGATLDVVVEDGSDATCRWIEENAHA